MNKAITYFLFLAFGLVIPLWPEGKIQLKRPVSPEADSTASGGGGAEKIEFAKPASSSAAAETDYTTSQGPEAKSRTLYMGPYLGFNYSGLANGMQGSVNNGGSDISAILGLRSELYFKRIYGIITDLGYEQNRAYIVETPTGGYAGNGILRTDYLALRSMFSYRYSMYKVLGKVKFLRPVAEALKPFAGNLQAGFFAKTPLSAQLEILNSTIGNPDDQLYDVKEFAKPVSGGFMAGLGFELRLGSYIFFFEGQYFRGLMSTYGPMQSRYFNTDQFSEQGFYFSSGLKTGIYGF
jgi:hypothetical protein